MSYSLFSTVYIYLATRKSYNPLVAFNASSTIIRVSVIISHIS